jgi:hypothetical protein
MCSKFTTRVKQSLKIRRLPPGLNPRHSSHEVETLPLDYGGRYRTYQHHIFHLRLRTPGLKVSLVCQKIDPAVMMYRAKLWDRHTCTIFIHEIYFHRRGTEETVMWA